MLTDKIHLARGGTFVAESLPADTTMHVTGLNPIFRRHHLTVFCKLVRLSIRFSLLAKFRFQVPANATATFVQDGQKRYIRVEVQAYDVDALADAAAKLGIS
jgi:hypothetical protein